MVLQNSALPEPTPPSDDADLYASFKWRFGGFDGSKAALSSPRISNLETTARQLSFTWDVGMREWGLSDGDAGAICALFCWTPDETRGGKFDWISVSRSSREFSHCNGSEPYNGWSMDGIPNPCRYWFVIVSRDGKHRSNVLEGTWAR